MREALRYEMNIFTRRKPLPMCRRSSGCRCRVLLENQAVETMDFVLGSQVGLQKWKPLEPVIFKMFGVSLSASTCVYELRLRVLFLLCQWRWFLRALQITEDPNAGLCPTWAVVLLSPPGFQPNVKWWFRYPAHCTNFFSYFPWYFKSKMGRTLICLIRFAYLKSILLTFQSSLAATLPFGTGSWHINLRVFGWDWLVWTFPQIPWPGSSVLPP